VRWSRSTRECQRAAFRRQSRRAWNLGLPFRDVRRSVGSETTRSRLAFVLQMDGTVTVELAL